MRYPTVEIRKGHNKRVKGGHPWIFSNELKELPKFESGTLIDVNDSNGQFIGRGYYNPHSLISIRILTQNKERYINTDFFKKRLINAIQYRKALYPDDDSYRLIYSEGDFLPGLIVDKYANHIVLQCLTAGIERHKDTICQLLCDLLQPVCIYDKSDANLRNLEGLKTKNETLYGQLDPKLIIQQDEIEFHINIQEGQKTGFFFDHRNNRKSLQSIIYNKSVLDLYCGTGAWSLYAAKYCAKQVIGIDNSKPAIELAKLNQSLNPFGQLCSFIHEDCFDACQQLRTEGKRFDLIICDPPAFTKSKQNLPMAIKGYRKINRFALGLLNPEGFLITSSCSHHVSRDIFREIIQDSGRKAKRTMKLLRYGTQSPDHPILLNVPETEYLKCLTCMAL